MTVVACAMLLALGGRAEASDPNYKWCFSPAFAGWRNFPEPKIDDGIIGSDQGWSNAYSYTFNNGVVINGVNQPDVIVYGLHKDVPTDHLMLGFQVKNDDTLETADTVMVMFDYGAATNPRYGLVTLQPIGASGDVVTQATNANVAQYYTSTTGTTESWGSPAGAPSWITWAATRVKGAGCGTVGQGGCSWDVEMKIELGQPGGPKRPESVYLNVLRAQTNGIVVTQFDSVVEFPWPRDQFVTTDMTGTPDQSTWGGAFVGTTGSCRGVFFDPSEIAATPLNAQGEIQPGVSTTLTANIHNNSISGTDGTPKVAKGVKATFQFAKFGGGSFGAFTPIGTTAATDLSPGVTPMSVTWASPPAVPPGDDGHRCILVTLDSASNDTTLINRGEFRNMTIHHASSYQGFPVISVKGLPPPPAGQTKQKIRLSAQTSLQFAYGDGTVDGIPAGTLTAQLSWLFHVTRDTGKVITLGGKKLHIWQPLPSFGFSIQAALSIDAQKAFEARHAQLMRSREISTENMRSTEIPAERRQQMIRDLNTQLASDPEQPSAKDWTTELAIQPVPGSGGRIYELDIPVEGEARIPATVAFGLAVSNGGGCCPGASGASTTPSKVGSLGLVVLVGAVVGRRRRRR